MSVTRLSGLRAIAASRNVNSDYVRKSTYFITINSQKRALRPDGTPHPRQSAIEGSLIDAVDHIFGGRPNIAAVCDAVDASGQPTSAAVLPASIVDVSGTYALQAGAAAGRGGRIHIHAAVTIRHTGRLRLNSDRMRAEVHRRIGNPRWLGLTAGGIPNRVYVNVKFIPDEDTLLDYMASGLPNESHLAHGVRYSRAMQAARDAAPDNAARFDRGVALRRQMRSTDPRVSAARTLQDLFVGLQL